MNEELKKPSGFLWMDEWAELTAELTNEQIGVLLRAAQNFHLGQDYDIGQDKELKMAFRFISNCIKQNDEKYGRACRLKAEARERQIRNRNKKNGIIEDMPTNAEISEDMPTNADYQNTNTNTNTSTNQSTSTNTKENKNTTPYKKGVSVTPAPAREDFLETFGLLNNVKMAPEQHRHLVEDYGQEATDATIDDLSCKLADGTVDSSNHYATLLSWLRYQRRNGGTATMSSTQAVPTYKPTPEEQQLNDLLEEWRTLPKDAYKGDNLEEMRKRHGQLPDEFLKSIGMCFFRGSWYWKS